MPYFEQEANAATDTQPFGFYAVIFWLDWPGCWGSLLRRPCGSGCAGLRLMRAPGDTLSADDDHPRGFRRSGPNRGSRRDVVAVVRVKVVVRRREDHDTRTRGQTGYGHHL